MTTPAEQPDEIGVLNMPMALKDVWHGKDDQLIGRLSDGAVRAIEAYAARREVAAQLKRLKDFRLAWSGEMSDEAKDSLDFQIGGLEATLRSEGADNE